MERRSLMRSLELKAKTIELWHKQDHDFVIDCLVIVLEKEFEVVTCYKQEMDFTNSLRDPRPYCKRLRVEE